MGYGEQTACEMKRNAYAFETPTLVEDKVHRRDMTVPGREDIYIYKQERPADKDHANHKEECTIPTGFQ